MHVFANAQLQGATSSAKAIGMRAKSHCMGWLLWLKRNSTDERKVRAAVSKIQCAAVRTWRLLIKVPVHSTVLQKAEIFVFG